MRTFATRDFGILRLTGRDATKFLQGYTTCDLAPVTAGGSSIGAICNLKGRMVTSFRVAVSRQDLLLRMHRALVPETITFLSKYIVFSKAEMHDVSAEWQVIGVTGADAASGVANSTELLVGVEDNRAEIWTPIGQDTEADSDAWHRLDIESGLAWVTPETAGEYLPQMFAYDALGAVDFEKGCYLGQEIVARAHFRGNVKRQLYRASSSAFLPIGTALGDGQRDVGQVVAAAPAAQGGGAELLVVAPAGATGRLAAKTGARNTTAALSWSIPKE